jgi:hypothetical protein
MKLFRTSGRAVLLCLTFLVLCHISSGPLYAEEFISGDKIILGQKEQVRIEPSGLLLDGRVDTGAAMASLHAENIIRFIRNGEEWVHFNLNPGGADCIMELPLFAVVKVRQANTVVLQERPIVTLSIRMGELQMDANFTLTDRSLMSVPLLIGRNILKDRFLVDVSGEYLLGFVPQD